MKVIYPVVFTETKDKENTILVYIPDLDGMTEGYGIEDAISMAKDFIGNALCEKADSEIPSASPIANIDITKTQFFDAGYTFVSLVDTDISLFRRIEKSRNVRRNITLPEWLDDMASKAKINVSAVAQNALKTELGVAL
ncbi:MAG: type II toxin-antitoxin system HicB family antitoxin [Treponema sp.]|nr:type II toxin-antitoxin system HicB family antitoxin [Treponema sp.]